VGFRECSQTRGLEKAHIEKERGILGRPCGTPPPEYFLLSQAQRM
jgi:hypothetical protein